MIKYKDGYFYCNIPDWLEWLLVMLFATMPMWLFAGLAFLQDWGWI